MFTVYNDIAGYQAAVAAGKPALINSALGTVLVLIGAPIYLLYRTKSSSQTREGEKHKGCAKKCIEGGGPVGLLTADDQLYLVIGEHKPINTELAAKAAETVTLKGKVGERNGMKMIENAELQ